MTITDVQTRPQLVVRGVTFIIAAMFLTSLQDVIFKLFSKELSLWQIFSVSTLSLSFNLVMLIAGLAGSLLLVLFSPSDELVHAYPYIFAGWSVVNSFEWFVLGILALLTAVINMGIAGAYKVAPPSTVATFEYSYLVFVVIWDMVFFDTSPSLATIVGMLMIVGAGLMVLRRK